MKLHDIVTQLQLVLPKHTDYFSETLSVSTIVASGGTATVTTSSPHGLTTGYSVSIIGAEQNTPLTAVSKDGLVFTFTTTTAHDLTYGYPGYETVNLSGFTDGAWNDSFTLMAVDSRTTFKVKSTNTLPSLNTNEVLPEARMDGINGYYSVTVVDTTSFAVTGDFLDGSYYNATAKTSARIAGSVTINMALEKYTKHSLDDMWLFVVAGDGGVSKDRTVTSDARVSVGGGDMKLTVVDGFSVYAVKNTTNESAAASSLDIARHELLGPIVSSLFGVRLDTGVTATGIYPVMFLGHGLEEYDRAYLVYRYDFEFAYELSSSDSVLEAGDTRAFAQIQTFTNTVGGDDTTDLTITDINLPS